MKILVVSAVLPFPLHSGGQVRMYNLLKRLSKRHEITLVSFIRNEEERAYKDDLSFCHEVYMINRGRAWQLGYVVRAVCTRMPFLLSTYANGRMYKLLSTLLAKHAYDALHIEPFYVWPSIPNTTVPIVVSEHNIEYQVYDEYVKRVSFLPLQPLLNIDVEKLKRWERYVWRKADRLIAVSTPDLDTMQEYLGFPVSLVPNGVDTSSFMYKKQPRDRKKITILFVGNFRWLPNVDAAKRLLVDIWPLIERQFPESVLRIVGRHIPESIQKMSTHRIHCLDDISDIRTEYAHAFALLAPMTIAGGTKFKILEAMASGVPVISTKEGIEGIDCQQDTHVLIAKSNQSFVDQLMRLDKDASLVNMLTKNARTLVERAYNWDIIANSLHKVWKSMYGKK